MRQNSFSGMVALVSLMTAVTFLIVSVVRGFDPMSAIAACAAIATMKYVVQ